MGQQQVMLPLMTARLVTRAPALLALAMLAASAGTAQRQAEEGGLQLSPATGVLCMWALVTAVAEVGRRCRAGEDPAFQAELDLSVERVDEFVRRNSDSTPEQVAAFKREQGLVGAPAAQLCTGDPLQLYEAFASAGPDALRSSVDDLLARPGPPTWGTCL